MVVTAVVYMIACVSRSSTRSIPSLPTVVTSRLGLPLIVALNSGMACVRSQSCESFGTMDLYQRSLPVRISSTTLS